MSFAGKIDKMVAPLGKYAATDQAMRRWGLDNLMKVGRAYNRVRHAARARTHARAFRLEREVLLREAGAAATTPRLQLRDGWALDTTGTLPHLDRLLDEAASVIRERGGRHFHGQQYSFMRSLLFPGDLEHFPSYLDFICSPELLAIAMDYLGTVPRLSKAQPPGVRFMESNLALDEEPHLAPRHSQLYHIDYYDSPQVYVLVALEDITPESGPWTFLSASATDRIADRIGYRRRGFGYRVPDDVIRPHILEGEEIAFTVPKGGVLFIDSSRCFHYGSRNCVKPRFMMMYGLQSPVRCDFAQTFVVHEKFPLAPDASKLRRMVLS
jgi:hypothetical protein